MSEYTKYLVCRFFALLCIFGAGYGYLSADLSLLFGLAALGLILAVASVYFRGRADSHKNQQSVAVETLSRIEHNRNK